MHPVLRDSFKEKCWIKIRKKKQCNVMWLLFSSCWVFEWCCQCVKNTISPADPFTSVHFGIFFCSHAKKKRHFKTLSCCFLKKIASIFAALYSFNQPQQLLLLIDTALSWLFVPTSLHISWFIWTDLLQTESSVGPAGFGSAQIR